MIIKDILRRIVRRGTSPEKETMEYCFAHGFTAEKTFNTIVATRLMPIGRG